MTRSEWQTQFTDAWKAKTITYVKNSDPDTDPDYEGVDFSKDNQWVSDDKFFFGSPYRKEVSPDDILGTYQAGWFKMKDGIITEIHDFYRTATFLGLHLTVGFDLFAASPDPSSAVSSFYHETGMMY